MARTFTIDIEEVDIDVCYGDYDGFVRKTMFYVSMFENDERVNGCGFFVEDDAKARGQQFIENGLEPIL